MASLRACSAAAFSFIPASKALSRTTKGDRVTANSPEDNSSAKLSEPLASFAAAIAAAVSPS